MELSSLTLTTLGLHEKALRTIDDTNLCQSVVGNAIGNFLLLFDTAQAQIFLSIFGKDTRSVRLLLDEQVELNGSLGQVIDDAISRFSRLHRGCLLLCHCYNAT